MFDEVTRQQDHYWASLIYAQEEARAKGLAQGIEEGIEQGIEQGIKQGIEQGIKQGIERGIEQGIEQGKITAIVNLVKEGIISKELGAQKLNLSEQEFELYL